MAEQMKECDTCGAVIGTGPDQCSECREYNADQYVESLRTRIATLEAEIEKIRDEWYSPEHMDKLHKRTIEPLLLDAKLLEFLLANPALKVMGSDERGWVVWDQSNGLEIVGRGKTPREALMSAHELIKIRRK